MEFLNSLIGTVIGGLITWYFSKRYYERASVDLQKETAELRRLTNLILVGMEIAGLVEIARNENGTILGYNFLSVGRHTEITTISDKATVQVEPEKPG